MFCFPRLGKVVVKDKLMSEGMVKYFQRQTREDQSINKTSGTPTDIAVSGQVLCSPRQTGQ